jgi:large subunit ribosomal protein L18
MDDTRQARLRRARKTRSKIAELKVARLCVYRTNSHIYAQIIDGVAGKVLASASTAEAEVRKEIANGGNAKAAAVVGKRIAERAKTLGLAKLAFDRSGFKYHGRVKALADAAREHGLAF